MLFQNFRFWLASRALRNRMDLLEARPLLARFVHFAMGECINMAYVVTSPASDVSIPIVSLFALAKAFAKGTECSTSILKMH